LGEEKVGPSQGKEKGGKAQPPPFPEVKKMKKSFFS